jgi:hypothetical protein
MKRVFELFRVLFISAARPPTKTVNNEKFDTNFYNLTMTYKLNSDVKWLYGEVKDRLSGETVAPNVDVKWRDAMKDCNHYGEQ